MAICPVCKTECTNNVSCSNCGFDQLNIEFLNHKDAECWEREILIPYRVMWLSQNKDYQFSGTTLLRYTGQEMIVKIPSFVTKIDESAFSRNVHIEEIILPKLLKKIGKWAFSNCENLREIRIPDSVTEICEYAFYGCDKLTLVHVGEGVSKIGAYTFDKCPNLHYLYLGKSVEELLCEDAFSSPFNDCGYLEITVNPENRHYYVENNCFIKRSNKHFLIKGNVRSVIPDYITTIGPYCFAGNNRLNDTITIPSGIVEILDAAFFECGLKQVILPEGLKKIRSAAFGCCNIDKVSIPASVVSVGEVPFDGQKITIFMNRTKSDIDHRIMKSQTNWNKCKTEEEYSCVLADEYWDSYWDKNGEYNDELGASEPSKVYYKNEWHYENGVPVPNENML